MPFDASPLNWPLKLLKLPIAEKAELTEQRNNFLSVAESRYSAIVASGRTIPWADMQRYLKGKVAGKKVTRPAAKKLAR